MGEISLPRMLAMMMASAAFICSGNLFISASKVDGVVPYSSVTVTFLIEVFKLLVMLTTIVVTDTAPPARFKLRETFYYAVPAFLYALENNLNYTILRYLDAATVSVLWNLKIMLTAVLFRYVLKNPLSELHRLAIALLVLGVLTSESNRISNMQDDTAAEEKSTHDLVIGGLLVLLGTSIASCASVFTEWALKRETDCAFFWQNLQMYSFGVLFNGAGVLLVDGDAVMSNGFFHGYNKWTFAVVAVNCIGGISMDCILKYLDNIACAYAHSMAMMLTMLFSMVFFAFDLSLEFACGVGVLIISLYLYHHPLADVPPSPSLSPSKTDAKLGSSMPRKNVELTEGLKERCAKKRLAALKHQLTDTDDSDADDSGSASSGAVLSPRLGVSLPSALQAKQPQYIPVDLESGRSRAQPEPTLDRDD